VREQVLLVVVLAVTELDQTCPVHAHDITPFSDEKETVICQHRLGTDTRLGKLEQKAHTSLFFLRDDRTERDLGFGVVDEALGCRDRGHPELRNALLEHRRWCARLADTLDVLALGLGVAYAPADAFARIGCLKHLLHLGEGEEAVILRF
jgi:hypothetical protein